MTTALGSTTSQLTALVVRATAPPAKAAQLVALVAYAPASAKDGRSSQILALTPYAVETNVLPRTSQLAGLIVYATGVPDASRSRAWTFTLDGHTFYVLDLGEEGTFVYDMVTKQWSNFDTDGYGTWNMKVGTMWGNRIIAGDTLTPQVWEFDPNAVQDEGWRSIDHTVTGIFNVRGRTFIGCDALRLTASVGQIDDVDGASMALSFSDDQGQTFTAADPVLQLDEADYSAELAWRSLGSFAGPGRVFQISDTGGLVRIDGADLYLDGFDEPEGQE